MSKKKTIALISDTHSYLDPALVPIFQGLDHIIHAGDIGDEAVLEELERLAPVTAVRGNIDGGPLRFLPLEQILEVNGRRIAVLHIAGSPARPRRAARELLQRERPDAIIVGHSHIPVVGKVQGALWINPGAAGRVGFHLERFAALLHISESGEFSLERICLGPRSIHLDE